MSSRTARSGKDDKDRGKGRLFIEIVRDVLPGDAIASTNLANLFEGAKVNITE